MMTEQKIEKMKVLILTADSNGAYPVPATKGGAVSTLIEHLIEGNEYYEGCELEIASFYNADALEKSKQYANTRFIWIKVPGIIQKFDSLLFSLIKIIKRDEKVISFKTIPSLLYYIWRARIVIKHTDADKIVVENNIPLALSLKKSRYKGQWYYHLHNVPRVDAGCRDVMSNTTRFLCVSQFVADKICSDGSAIGKIPREKVAVLHNCIDTNIFRPLVKDNENILRYKSHYGINDNDRILIFTGRLSQEKGADVLLEAMTMLPNNVRALIVGGFFGNTEMKTDYQMKLHRLADSLGSRVIFTGYVQHSDLPYLYNVADIAVLPSIWDEPAGLTNLEAMACGIPIITTDAGGIPEYIGTAASYPRDNKLVEHISEEVRHLIDDPIYYKQRSQEGRRLVEESFNSYSYMEKFANLLG